MPADISLDSVSKTSALQLQTRADDAATAAATTSKAPIAASASPKLANPVLTVDPSVNRVVLEYFSTTGVLTNTIPSQSQLEAYRLAAFSGNPLTAADSTDGA
jgi:outer membrane receptor for monomeric catechols